MKTKNIHLKSIFCSTIFALSLMAVQAQVTDNGMTNDFHKANVGKIVFSKTEIVKSTTSNESLTNTFELGDDIYGRVYLAKSMTNELAAMGNTYMDGCYKYRITVDGKPLVSSFFDGILLFNSDKEFYDTWTTFQLAVSPGNTEGYPTNEYRAFFAAIWELSNGSHKVKFDLVVKSSSKENVIASGEFNLNVTEDGKTKTGNKICPDLFWLSMDASSLPEAPGLVEASKKAGEKVLKVILIANDWKYTNTNGVTVNRWMNGKAVYQDLKTKLCYDVDAIFVQETTNNGITFQSTTYSRDGEMNYKVIYSQSCIK